MKNLLYNHGTLLNVMYLPECKGVGDKMDTCMCMVDSLCCTPETITTLLISYTQYKMFLVLKKKTN